MTTQFLIAFLIFYFWHIMGVTIGYHRLLSHRSFRCAKFVEYFWVLGGYLAFEGSPVWWVSVHRAHHRYTDKPQDPHSPRFGWQKALYGWLSQSAYPDHITPASQCRDLVKDPIYKFLEQDGNWRRAHILTMSTGLLFRLVLLLFCGWHIALASFLAGILVQQIPLLLNVVCHIPRLGYKNYQTAEDSVNVWWVALLSAGEGWHNNHHAHPGSARSGLRPFELDLSWIMIRLMKCCGLVGWLREESLKQNPIHEAKI
jgi:fatty-acid desaturase